LWEPVPGEWRRKGGGPAIAHGYFGTWVETQRSGY
jgi:hypothetical protein